MATREENFVDEGELLQAESLEDKLTLIPVSYTHLGLESGWTVP